MKKRGLIITIIVLLVVLLVIYLAFRRSYGYNIPLKKLPIPEDISQKVKGICEEQKEIRCEGSCLDGFGEKCYFDSTTYNKSELEVTISLPFEIRELCLGIHSTSVCEDCHNTFELKKVGELQEVSCEEFFQTIEDKNQSCNGCMDIIYSGCC